MPRFAAVLLCILLFPGGLGAHVARLTSAEIAAASANVVVAVVESREVRWNDRHTLLMTDYTLRVEDRLRGLAPERFTLTMPGGTLGSLSDEVCTAVDLEPGARYLLFLGGLDRPSLSPVVGAWQGAFRETPDFPEAVAAARDLLDRTPLAPRRAAASASTPLPGKTWVPLAEPFLYVQPARPPIEVNPLPAGSPFSPVDQERLAYWNLYAGDLFRVSPNPTATWSFGNGVFDIAGFVPDQKMTEQFQVSWDEIGTGVLGVAFVRRRDGAVIESDVALNPAKAWTLDPLEATVRGGAFSFQEVITHEIGHMWGLKHTFETPGAWYDSVMQYKSKIYYFGTLFADDAKAVRSAFPPGVKLRDGLVSSWVTSWQNGSELNTYTPARPKSPNAKAGGTFTLTGPIKVENAGTVALTGLKVEVYLAPQRLSFEGAVRVKTLRVPGTLASGAIKQLSVGKLTIPGNLPAGTYWLAYYLRDSKDAFQANNSAWSNYDLTLTVSR